MSKPKITYLEGDATRPIGEGNKIICHICNNVGGWGAGFVLAISARWSAPEAAYRAKDKYILGTADIIPVEHNKRNETIAVANMIAQHDISDKKVKGVKDEDITVPPIRYGAVRLALSIVNDYAYKNGYTLHMPRIGCGLAGGEWELIEVILKQVISVDTFVYDLV